MSPVYRIVQQSGGHGGVSSRLGQGTTFTIDLPTGRKDPAVSGGSATAVLRSGRGETILVVEDADSVRQFIADMLRDHGYRVVEATSGTQALDHLRSEPQGTIRLVLTDMVTPGMNGPKLRRRVTSNHRAVNIILMSGCTDHFLLKEDILIADEPSLQKPFNHIGLLQ